MLEWASLTNWQGFAKGYHIEYKIYDTQSVLSTKVFSSVTSKTLENLSQFTAYFVTIAAETGAGKGPRSACVPKTQEGGKQTSSTGRKYVWLPRWLQGAW